MALELPLDKYVSGASSNIKSVDYSTSGDLNYHVKVHFAYGNIKVYIDGEKLIDVNDTTFLKGGIGLGACTGGGTWTEVSGYFDNIFVSAPIVTVNVSFYDGYPVALWHMDEGSGNTIYDITTNNNDGTIHGATWVDGKYGKALEFDGVDDYVEIPDDDSLDPTNAISIELWVKPDDITSEMRWVTKFDWTPDHTYSFVQESDGVLLQLYAGGSLEEFRVNNCLTTDWQHMVAVYDCSNIYIYRNGALLGSTPKTGTLPSNSKPLYIGVIYTNVYKQYFNGIIDEVAIYNRALTEEEIKSHYENSMLIGTDTITIPAGGSAVASINWTPITTGNHTIYVVVDPNNEIEESNESNNAASRNITVSVANHPPDVTDVQILPSNPTTTSKLTVNYTYYDEDNDPGEGTTYKWYKNEGYGFNLTILTTKSIGFENTKKGEIWKYEVTPKDGEDFGIPVNSTEVEIKSTLPIIKNMKINPEKPKTNDDLAVNYEYFDADNDTKYGTSFRWYKKVGDDFVYANIDTINVKSDETLKGEKWRCEIIPKNKFESGAPVTSDFVTILNSPPTIANVTGQPSKAYTTDELSVSYDFNDIDGDLESGTTYKWYKDEGNGFIDSGITTKTVASENTAKHEKWRCEVTPKDGEDFGDTVTSNPIEILNSKPIAKITSPKNGEIFDVGTEIGFDASDSTDADNDILTFKWTEAGVIGSEEKYLMSPTY